MLQGGWESYRICGYFKQGERKQKVAKPVFSHPFFVLFFATWGGLVLCTHLLTLLGVEVIVQYLRLRFNLMLFHSYWPSSGLAFLGQTWRG